jgi:hypothetical protein
MRFVPQFEVRLADSAVQTAALYMQLGINMAGLVALCAVLEQARRTDLVNLPALLHRLENASERRYLANRRAIEANVFYRQFEAIKSRFKCRIEPMIEEVKAIRDTIAAHHGQADPPPTTYGRVSRLAERTIVLVEQLHLLANGPRLDMRKAVQDIRWQSAALWAKGLDGQWGDQNIVSVETDEF